MNIGFFGHTPDDFSNREEVKAQVFSIVEQVGSEHGSDLFCLFEPQIGVPQWACEAALELGIPYGLYLPIPAEQWATYWYSEQKETLLRQCQHASSVYVANCNPEIQTNKKYFSSMERLVDDADALVFFWLGKKQGHTYNAVKYGDKKNKIMHNAFLDMDLISINK